MSSILAGIYILVLTGIFSLLNYLYEKVIYSETIDKINKKINLPINLIRLFQTLITIPLTLTLWVLLYDFGRIGLFILDYLRGTDEDPLQIIFIELITPGLASYFTLNFAFSILSKIDRRIILVLFIITFSVLYFAAYSDIKPLYQAKAEWFKLALKIVFPISTFIGAIISFKNYDN